MPSASNFDYYPFSPRLFLFRCISIALFPSSYRDISSRVSRIASCRERERERERERVAPFSLVVLSIVGYKCIQTCILRVHSVYTSAQGCAFIRNHPARLIVAGRRDGISHPCRSIRGCRLNEDKRRFEFSRSRRCDARPLVRGVLIAINCFMNKPRGNARRPRVSIYPHAPSRGIARDWSESAAVCRARLRSASFDGGSDFIIHSAAGLNGSNETADDEACK